MSIETRAQRHRTRSRRRLVVIATLGAFVLLAVGGVAVWSRDSWRDEAMSSSVFPDVSGEGWADTPSADGWGSGSGPDASSTAPTPATPGPGTASVDPARATPSQVPTIRAPQPAASSAPATTVTTAPTATSTPRQTGKGRHKPKPTQPPRPSSTTSPDSGCLLLVIC